MSAIYRAAQYPTSVPRSVRRAQVHAIEAMLGSRPQIELRVEHEFADGLYTRKMFIPAGVALVGHIHKHPCLNIVPVGDIWVATEEGSKRIVGPVGPFPSPAGTKRVGWAQKDTIWITIHANPTNERDVDRLEDFLIAQGYDEALSAPETLEIGGEHAQVAP